MSLSKKIQVGAEWAHCYVGCIKVQVRLKCVLPPVLWGSIDLPGASVARCKCRAAVYKNDPQREDQDWWLWA